jgi:glutamate-1-semialdehyde 2,1-aminomutase
VTQGASNLFILIAAILRSNKIINLFILLHFQLQEAKGEPPPLSPMAELGLTVKSQYNPSSHLSAVVLSAKERYVQRNPNSGKLFEEATSYLPGGNTRTLLYSAPFPLCMKKGEDYKVVDEDGHV